MPDQPVLAAGLIAAVILAVGTAVWLALVQLRPGVDWTEVGARIKSWWVMAAVIFGAVLLPPPTGLVFFGAVSFWAVREYFALQTAGPTPAVRRLAFAAIPVQYLLIAVKWYGVFVLWIPLYMFLVMPARLVAAQQTDGFLRSAASVQWGLLAFVFGVSHMGYLTMVEAAPDAGRTVDGRSLLLFLLIVVEMSDVLQFVWGKSVGRHRILPNVSPNKTWEGFIGGVASATLLSAGLRFLTPFSLVETIGVAALITVAGFLGGAVMSAVKRDAGVKDFGTMIPGHGGVIDRLDALCYAAPVFFHYVRFVHGPAMGF